MSNPADAWRRWFGLLFLFVALGMLIWGQTLLKPHLAGLAYLAYWLVCFLFTFLAMLTALLDLFIIRRRAREEHRELLKKALRDKGLNGDQADERPGRDPGKS